MSGVGPGGISACLGNGSGGGLTGSGSLSFSLIGATATTVSGVFLVVVCPLFGVGLELATGAGLTGGLGGAAAAGSAGIWIRIEHFGQRACLPRLSSGTCETVLQLPHWIRSAMTVPRRT